MYSVWTKHLKTDEEKENFKNSIYGSRFVLNRAIEIFQEEEASLNQAMLSNKIYDQPNWDYRQAHTNGFLAGLQFAKKLLTVDQTESK